MRVVILVLLLLPILLIGALACSGEDAEPTMVADPTPTSAPQATAEPEPTMSDAAPPPTPAPAEPTATAAPAPTATTAPTEPVESPEPTEVPADTPTPEPTEEPADTPEPATAGPAPGPDSFIVGEGSQITFTVEEETNFAPVRFDAVISGTGLTGFANLDGSTSVVLLDLHSLESDQSFRDRYIRDRMFPDTPTATVTVESLPDLPQSFLDGEVTEGTLDGSLQIGDTITPLTFDVEARLDPGVINVLGKTTFTWEELGLAKPIFGPVTYLGDEVEVQVLIVAHGQ